MFPILLLFSSLIVALDFVYVISFSFGLIIGCFSTKTKEGFSVDYVDTFLFF
jgi:hypothetical protein